MACFMDGNRRDLTTGGNGYVITPKPISVRVYSIQEMIENNIQYDPRRYEIMSDEHIGRVPRPAKRNRNV